ncbi:MAG: type IV toxin-antitoxin system AbiEi family antitoxin domain-containing protein [Methylibium sp.]
MNVQLLGSTPKWYKTSEDISIRPRIQTMPAAGSSTQRTQALALLRRRGMTRLAEFNTAGITATTVSRMERAGEVVRLARGLYQLSDAELDTQQSLAEAARLVPKGVICLASALAFHGLTDQMPTKVWIAIGRKDWRPRVTYPPIRIARFSDELLRRSVEQKKIAGTSVPVFGVAKTVADLFRYRRTVGDTLAIEGLRQALRQRKATPGEITREAKAAGAWATMEPYVMALTSDA